MLTSSRLVAATVIAVLGFAAGAGADPVRVTAGRVSFDTGGPAAFTLLGSNGQVFEAEGFRNNWPATCFFECAPGVSMPISIFPEAISDGSMFFRADGVDMFPVMDLVISGPSVILGSEGDIGDGPFAVWRPFTLSGWLAGYASPDHSGPPIFSVMLTGRGTARLGLTRENGRYTFSSLDYDFEAAPVPEPATLLLVGSGAALMWRRRQRRG
jgi:hypothetical protein